MTSLSISSDITSTLPLAQAAAGGAPPGGLLGNPLVFMVLMFVMMYFVLIRPQRKKQQDHQKLVDSLSIGDQIIMNGGEHGIVTSVQERTVKVKVADNVKIEYDPSAVATVVKKSGKVEDAVVDVN